MLHYNVCHYNDWIVDAVQDEWEVRVQILFFFILFCDLSPDYSLSHKHNKP